MSLNVFAFDFAPRVAGCKLDAIGYFEALHLGRSAVGESVKLAIGGRNPERRGHTLAVAAERDKADVGVRCQFLE